MRSLIARWVYVELLMSVSLPEKIYWALKQGSTASQLWAASVAIL